jgi:hypothetical protein
MKNYEYAQNPLILQFTMRDPDSGQTILFTTNVDLGKKFEGPNEFKWNNDLLLLRNILIQQEIRSTATVADSDRKHPIDSQLDLALRSLSGTKLNQSGNYCNAGFVMEWKPHKSHVVHVDQVKAKVEQYSDKALQLLMQMLFFRCDLISLGCTAATDAFSKKKNAKQAKEQLLRLVPHKLQIFAVVLGDKGFGDEVKKTQVNQLTSMVIGSSELLRHCLHTDPTRSMKSLFKLLSKPVISAD